MMASALSYDATSQDQEQTWHLLVERPPLRLSPNDGISDLKLAIVVVWIRDEELELKLVTGEARYGQLLLLFHVPSGRYWWTVRPEPGGRMQAGDRLDDGNIAFIASDRLIVFTSQLPSGG